MKKLVLKLNHSIFKWYYKRCGDHFRQWTFFKSVKLLISNFEHLQLLLKNAEAHNRNLTRDTDQLRKELFQNKMQQMHPDHIDWVNDVFGTDLHKNTEN